MRRYGIHNLGILSVPEQGSGVPGINWLLRDDYTDTRAAGAMNGTPAVPGPGTRTVVDSGNNLSTGGGLLVVGGVAGANDPKINYNDVVIARANSPTMLIYYPTVGIAASRGRISFGLGPLNGGYLSDSGYGDIVGQIEAVANGAGTGVRYNPNSVVAEEISLAVTARPGGGTYYWIKATDLGTNWLLFWISDVGSDVVVYPVVSTRVAGAPSPSHARIPSVVWLPNTMIYDTFTRANGALGNTEAAGPDGQGVEQSAWQNLVGTTVVSGNAASASALAGGIAIAAVSVTTPDVLCRARTTRAGGDVGIVVRYADSSNYVIGYHDGTSAIMDKVVGGATTNLVTVATGYVAGAFAAIICSGTSFTLFYNNVQRGVTQTVADASLQNGATHGLYTTNTGNSQDAFLTMPRGTSSEYSLLDGWNNA
jgi:hypothetical protein